MVRACKPARISSPPFYGNASLLPVAANGSSDWYRPGRGGQAYSRGSALYGAISSMYSRY
jgi:hypothetical protein